MKTSSLYSDLQKLFRSLLDKQDEDIYEDIEHDDELEQLEKFDNFVEIP